jgi:hypothetical protein
MRRGDADGCHVVYESPVGFGFLTIFGPTATAIGCQKRKFLKNPTATAKNRKKLH